jgi:hypothetical protein
MADMITGEPIVLKVTQAPELGKPSIKVTVTYEAPHVADEIAGAFEVQVEGGTCSCHCSGAIGHGTGGCCTCGGGAGDGAQ